MEQSYQISWYAPNFINMCIDNINDGELSGRIYHCYSKEPWKFTNILQLIELADDFFDKLVDDRRDFVIVGNGDLAHTATLRLKPE